MDPATELGNARNQSDFHFGVSRNAGSLDGFEPRALRFPCSTERFQQYYYVSLCKLFFAPPTNSSSHHPTLRPRQSESAQSPPRPEPGPDLTAPSSGRRPRLPCFRDGP